MKIVSFKTDYAFRELFSQETIRKQFLSDVLGIPPDSVRSVRAAGPYLWKRLQGTGSVDDWIRLFNAESEEDLEMIKTQNSGIAEAIEMIRSMSLRGTLRYLHEERLKAIRDRRAEDEYVWEQGREEGRAEGKTEGKAEGKAESILQLLSEKGVIPSDLRGKIMSENNMDTLGTWLKSAARSESIEEFRERNKI